MKARNGARAASLRVWPRAISTSKDSPITRAKSSADWASLMVETSLLCANASIVVALRSWRIMAGGPTAHHEIERMISEKVEAGSELTGALMGGRLKNPKAAARKTLSIYGKRVRGNRKRLAS